jgi:hypothetical protein
MIARLRSIPSLPTLYEELTAALRSENFSLAGIAKIISKDVGMAAKILQLATLGIRRFERARVEPVAGSYADRHRNGADTGPLGARIFAIRG